MNIFNLISKRRSVRTFDGRELSENDIERIIECASNANNPYSIPIEWKIIYGKDKNLKSPVIIGTDYYISGKMEKVEHSEEAFGYSFEKVVLYATSLGVGTTWIAGTMNREAFEKELNLAQNEVMPCISPIGYPAKKMSLRETMMRTGIKADSRLSFEKIFFNGDFNTPLKIEDSNPLNTPLESVRLAPSAVNKQPWRVCIIDNKVHFYLKHSEGYKSNNWDIQKIDMGIALCHFELVAKECGLNVIFEILDPNIAISENMEYIASFVIC